MSMTERETIERLSSIPIDVSAILRRWQNTDYLKLHAGEMFAREVRTVKAVLKAVETEVLALLPPDAVSGGEKASGK